MNKIRYFIFLCCCPIIGQASSLKGCTYANYDFLQCQITFESSDTGIIVQTNRVDGSTMIDTFLYSIENNLIRPVFLHEESGATDILEKTTYISSCWLPPYIYRDGVPIKRYPLGGTTAIRRSSPMSFYRTKIGTFFPRSSKFGMRLLSKDLLLCCDNEHGINYILELQTGNPQFTELADSLLNVQRYPQLKSNRLRREYYRGYSWEKLWFSRKHYECNIDKTIVGQIYQFSSTIKETLSFVNDTLCIYQQQFEDSIGSMESYCTYSILPNGLVVIRPDSSTFSRMSAVDYVTKLKSKKDYSCYQSKNAYSLINVVDSISCDTLLLCNDFLIYTKFYPTNSCSYYRELPSYVPIEDYLIISKAYIRRGKRVSSTKIGKYYQSHYVPINYP